MPFEGPGKGFFNLAGEKRRREAAAAEELGVDEVVQDLDVASMREIVRLINERHEYVEAIIAAGGDRSTEDSVDINRIDAQVDALLAGASVEVTEANRGMVYETLYPVLVEQLKQAEDHFEGGDQDQDRREAA